MKWSKIFVIHAPWITNIFASNLFSLNSFQFPSLQHQETITRNTPAEGGGVGAGKQVSLLKILITPSLFPSKSSPPVSSQVCSTVHLAVFSGSLFLSSVDPTDRSLLISPTLVTISQLPSPSGTPCYPRGHACQKTR